MALPESEKPRIDVRFNAVTSMLTVVLPGGTQAMPVEVLDQNGRSIRQTGLSGTGGQIALPGIASGTYMLRIGMRTERFVVGN